MARSCKKIETDGEKNEGMKARPRLRHPGPASAQRTNTSALSTRHRYCATMSRAELSSFIGKSRKDRAHQRLRQAQNLGSNHKY
jgi:hypothetical protein